MTDFLEDSILLEGLRRTFQNKKAKVKDDMVFNQGNFNFIRYCKICSKHHWSLLLCDSHYQTTNERKDNPGV